MDRSFAEELYSESLKLSKLELGSTSLVQNQEATNSLDKNKDDLSIDDHSLWDGSDEEVERSSDLDREWQRRRNQFHTAGYRDGVIAGKEAAAQEGFNYGFKQSVSDGYNWGLVRGVTSALALLPDKLKEKLVGTVEKRNGFQNLYESTHSVSTIEALSLFNDSIVAKKVKEEGGSEQNRLELYYKELKSLVLESPEIEVKLI